MSIEMTGVVRWKYRYIIAILLVKEGLDAGNHTIKEKERVKG